MISHFFIDRPIFASVLSIVITLAGAVAVIGLPVAQYPEVTPPTVLVTAVYPGANSRTVLDTVAAPIEAQVSGVENMLYMSSLCTNDGTYSLTVTFKMGMDSDMAQVLVQNRVNLALPVIPALVQREGINVRKMSPSTLMIVNLVSPDGRYDDVFLSNYATIEIKDEVNRLPGVAGITYLGQRDYSMRVWLNPDRMASLGISAADVVNAINTQNQQVAAGMIGQQPVPKGQQFQLTLNALGRLHDEEEFRNIILKVSQTAVNNSGAGDNTDAGGGNSGSSSGGSGSSSGTSGSSAAPAATGLGGQSVPSQTTSVVRLRDVARVKLESQQYDQSATLDGQPSVALSIYQLPGSNALDVSREVKAKMAELKKRFPEGVDYRIVYDTTPFIRESIQEVFLTLLDAVILVAIVVLLFLQDWRSTIIPLISVPVAVIGTFAVMAALGFSLNNLTLFGLVLAIGIVVDDAIVVVENVERWLEHGLAPRDAARKAMDEVTGPVIAVALVLCAVFVPCAFIGGITGQFFRQFAVTIAVSTVFSAINSLTLSPALAAILLRHKKGGTFDVATFMLFLVIGGGLPVYFYVVRGAGAGRWPLWLFALLTVPVGAAVFAGLYFTFNRVFNVGTAVYTRLVGALLRASVVALLVYGGLLALTWWGFNRVPAGFIPQQDKGYLILNVQLPDSASVERTRAAMARIEELARDTEGVAHTVGVSGQSLILGANAPNLGSMYVMLKPFEERGPDLGADVIAERIRRRCRGEVREAVVTAFGPPPVEGLGTTGGFKLVIEDRGNLGLDELQRVSDRVVAEGNAAPGLQGLFNSSRANAPWLYLDIDRTKCLSLGVPLDEVFTALQVNLGSYYVNNFNVFGRTWQVNVQADEAFRNKVRRLLGLQVRNNQGQMVLLGTVMRVRDAGGPVSILRYNMYSAAAVTGNTRPGTSSGQAVERMAAVARKELPPAMDYDWTELTFMQLQAGSTAMYVFGLAVVFVFLVLAAQYESWKLPLAVILVVPMCLLCSIAGVAAARMDVSIFTQIGFVVLVGLASKNAILIVEFAKAQRESGVPAYQATVEASRLRLRPILMTSFAFILGVLPLVIAHGAGAEMRRSLGTAVFAGMLGVTLFGIFLTPVFFYVLQWFGRQPSPPRPEPEPGPLRPTVPETGIRLPPEVPHG